MKWLVLHVSLIASCSVEANNSCTKLFDEAEKVFGYSMVVSKENFEEMKSEMKLCLESDNNVCSITKNDSTYALSNRVFDKYSSPTLDFGLDPAIVMLSGDTGCFVAVNHFVMAEPWGLYRIKNKKEKPDYLAEFDPRLKVGINELDLLEIIKDYDE